MKFEIKNRWTGSIIFEWTGDSLKLAVEAAVSQKIVLRDADLRGADLRDADLSDAVLRDAVLSGAVLRGAVLRDAVLRGALDDIPKIEDLDGKILKLIESGAGELDMTQWHTCETTHCRAGWAITLAGPFGRGLEWAMGSAAAGAMIYARAYPGMKIPDFYADDETAMEDIKARAALAKPAVASK